MPQPNYEDLNSKEEQIVKEMQQKKQLKEQKILIKVKIRKLKLKKMKIKISVQIIVIKRKIQTFKMKI